MELLEVEPSSSPHHGSAGAGSGTGMNDAIKNDVYNRLIANGNEDAVSDPHFRDKLEAHFDCLPQSYGHDINIDRVEDVLLHQRLLARAKDSDIQPVFNIRFLEANASEDVSASSGRVETLNLQPIHEIIFSTIDRPKLLSQLSALLSEVGLNIREAHVFSTMDGYSLELFVVDGWHSADTGDLYDALNDAVARSEGSWSGPSNSHMVHDRAIAIETRSEDWELDSGLLEIGEKIASGSCGDLHLGKYLGKDVAVKVLRSDLSCKDEHVFTREVTILRQIQHRNVIGFIGSCTKSPNLCIVTEYMSGGNLYEYLHENHPKLKLPQLLKFAIDVCDGMEYLHEKSIIHRDLKTSNLLLDASNVVKVADFGLARVLNQGGVMTQETGTYRWMAPEVISHQPYDHKADVFSFGVVLWELLTAEVPYSSMTPVQAAFGVARGLRPQVPSEVDPLLSRLMQGCWDDIPRNRPSFTEIRIQLEELLWKVEQQAREKVGAHGEEDQ